MALFKVKAEELPIGNATRVVGLNSADQGVLQDVSALQLPNVTTSPLTVQKFMMVCGTGPLDDPIFTGASNSPQGGCVLTIEGVEYIFLIIRVSGSTWATNETFRIGQWVLREDGGTNLPVAVSGELLLGHQPLSGYIYNGNPYLITGMRPTGSYTGDDAGKGYSRVTWRGNSTTQTDVANIPLFGLTASGHPYAAFNTATPFVSKDGQYIHLWANDTKGGLDDTSHSLFTYFREDAENMGLDAQPVYPITAINGPPRQNGYFLQGGASNSDLVVAARGYTAAFGFHGLQFFDMMGNLQSTLQFDDARTRYGIDGLLDHPTLGNPVQIEPEGCDFRSNNEIFVVVADSWRSDCPIVTYEGLNWASIAAGNVGNPPDEAPDKWVRTTKAATDGAYDNTVTYGNGTDYTRREKVIYSIRTPAGDDGEEPIERGLTSRGSGANLRNGGNTVDMSFALGDSFQAAAYSEQTGQSYLAFGHFLNSWRWGDMRFGSDRTKYINFAADFSTGREIGQFRVNGSINLGGAINVYGTSDGSFPGMVRVWGTPLAGTPVEFMRMDPVGLSVTPGITSTISIGSAAFKYLSGYFTSLFFGPSTAVMTSNAGTPESVVAAPVGSICSDTTNGVLYMKNTGTGNTGWKLVVQAP